MEADAEVQEGEGKPRTLGRWPGSASWGELAGALIGWSVALVGYWAARYRYHPCDDTSAFATGPWLAAACGGIILNAALILILHQAAWGVGYRVPLVAYSWLTAVPAFAFTHWWFIAQLSAMPVAGNEQPYKIDAWFNCLRA